MLVDLRSDTVTKPSAGMRAAMAAAEVGDDVYGEDPTVNALQARAAALVGKEAALFMPTGTMANLTALMCHSRPGESVLMSGYAHTYIYEGGNMAAYGGLMPVLVDHPYGKIAAEDIARRAIQFDDPHYAVTTCVAIENTTNKGGGAFYTRAEIEAIAAQARAQGLKLHCDGARFFNACVASGEDPAALGALCDSVCFCLSKGLGCPVGTMLCASRATIQRALWIRKKLGGGLRQAGVLAAAGLYALDHGHIEALAEDHRRAAEFRGALEVEGFVFPVPSPTNIVYLEMGDPLAAVGRMAQEGVLTLPIEGGRVRAVFHRDIDDAGLARAIDVFRRFARA